MTTDSNDATEWLNAVRRGDDAAAWSISDRILAARDKRRRNDPHKPYHCRWVWDGVSPAGQDVLVRCYHGLGDTLQFARFLPKLAAIAATVTIEAPPALVPLLRASGFEVGVVAFDQRRPLPASSCDIEIMELSHALRLPPEAAPPPYLRLGHFDVDAASPGRAVLPTAALCWRAGGWDEERSLPLPLLLQAVPPYWRLARVQEDMRTAEEAACVFINDAGSLATILATAALIVSATLVITVDTMVAHLAGALGRRSFVLLKHDADWRWELGAHSRWYPEARLIRQPKPGDWDGALASLRSALVRWPED